jgi:hypothetical protein
MRELSLLAAAAFVYLPPAMAQTQINLRAQSANVDFSAASYTKPLKTGTVIPAVCGVGEMFFKSDAPAGSNVYVCAATNMWSLQGNGDSALARVDSPEAEIITTAVVMIGGACSSESPCRSRFGTRVYSYTEPATATITAGSGQGRAVVYIAETGRIVLEHPAAAGLAVTTEGLDAQAVTTPSVPPSGIPVAEIDIAGGQWTTLTSSVSTLSASPLVAGFGIAVTEASGLSRIDIDGGIIPTLGGTNAYTGAQLAHQATKTAPVRTAALDPPTCDASSREMLFNTTTNTLKTCTAPDIWTPVGGSSAPVSSVANKTGDVLLTGSDITSCRVTGQGTSAATFAGPCTVVRNNYAVPPVDTATMEIIGSTGNQTGTLYLSPTDSLILVTTTAVTVRCTNCIWITNPFPEVIDDATPLATLTNTGSIWSLITPHKADIYLSTINAAGGGGLQIITNGGLRSLSLNSTVPRTTGVWPLLGDYDLSRGKLAPPVTAISSLPPAVSHSGYAYLVTDAVNGADCTTGGASGSSAFTIWCRSDGVVWKAIAAATGPVFNAGSGHHWLFGTPDSINAASYTGSTTVQFRETVIPYPVTFSAAHVTLGSAGSANNDAAWKLYDATCTAIPNSQITLENLPGGNSKVNAAGVVTLPAGVYIVGFASEGNAIFQWSVNTTVASVLNADSANPRLFTVPGVVATGSGSTNNWTLPASCAGPRTASSANVPNIVLVR